MDERTKATVRVLLDRHPRGYATEEVGFAVTNTAAGLFRLLCFSILADDSTPSKTAVNATAALLDRGWHSAPEMDKPADGERAEVLARVGYPDAEQAGRRLGEATRLVLDRYEGDLQNLRQAADGDQGRLWDLLREIPGMDDAGCAVFLRDVQMVWPEAGPFVDEHAARAARRLDLPSDPGELLTDGAAATRPSHGSWGRSRSSTPVTSTTASHGRPRGTEPGLGVRRTAGRAQSRLPDLRRRRVASIPEYRERGPDTEIQKGRLSWPVVMSAAMTTTRRSPSPPRREPPGSSTASSVPRTRSHQPARTAAAAFSAMGWRPMVRFSAAPRAPGRSAYRKYEPETCSCSWLNSLPDSFPRTDSGKDGDYA